LHERALSQKFQFNSLTEPCSTFKSEHAHNYKSAKKAEAVVIIKQKHNGRTWQSAQPVTVVCNQVSMWNTPTS